MIRCRFIAFFCSATLLVATQTGALPRTDQPAALLVFPYIHVDPSAGIDTGIRLANADPSPLQARCFLENTTSHCSGSGVHCVEQDDCPDGQICAQGWSVTEFHFTLTPDQPLGWRASTGLATLPLPENEGSIPPVPETPFVGVLRCLTVSSDDLPLAQNSLIGTAALETSLGDDTVDVASYNAFGFVADSVDADGHLLLGSEYSAPAGVVQLQFLYDGVTDPLFGDGNHETTLIAVPTAVDYVTPAASQSSVQALAINELEQRVMFPFSVGPQLIRRLNRLDVSDPAGSNLNVVNGGTVTGQLRMSVSGASGLVAVALERRRDMEGNLRASVVRSTSGSGVRPTPDDVRIPVSTPPTPTPTEAHTEIATATATHSPTPTPTGPEPCLGDCDNSGMVTVDELIKMVGIALGQDVSTCLNGDRDADGTITVDEILGAVARALRGC